VISVRPSAVLRRFSPPPVGSARPLLTSPLLARLLLSHVLPARWRPVAVRAARGHWIPVRV